MFIIDFFKKLFFKFKAKKQTLHYLNGSEALPSPLAEDEEREMLDKLSYGEAEAKDKLIEHNLRLVVYIARRFDNTGVDLDDLISIGTIGLIKAINSYISKKTLSLQHLLLGALKMKF